MKPVSFTDNGAATRQRMGEPCSVFADGSFGGGSLAIQVSRTATSNLITLATLTTDGVVNINILGSYYVTATLTGATTPSITVGSGSLPS